MSDFWLYFKLGLEHVLDWQAYDHILFLIVLCAVYTYSSWRRLLILVSLFTLGHTFSLLLAHYDVVKVGTTYIEFLIPITILVAAVFNVLSAKKTQRNEKYILFYIITIFFGLIHGFGFATYYEMINDGGNLLTLIEFALGIELAQLIVVFIVITAAFLFQNVFRISRRDWILVVSSIVIGMVVPMLVNNWPF